VKVVLAPRESVFSGSEKSPFQPKKQFLSSLEKSLLQVAKTLEIASGLFWRPEKASPFRFGKITFSVRQDARNYVTVVLAA